MGKKNKNKIKSSNWEVSSVDQEELADKLYEMERGNGGSVIGLLSPKDRMDGGFEDDFIYGKALEVLQNNPDAYGDYNNFPEEKEYTEALMEAQSTSNEGVLSLTNKPTTVPPAKMRQVGSNTMPRNVTPTSPVKDERVGVRVIVDEFTKQFRRIKIDDGITSTPIYLPAFSNFIVDLSAFTKSDISDTINMLINHITLLSHPFAVFKMDDFSSTDSLVNTVRYNKSKFKFFVFPVIDTDGSQEDYVACYYIDLDSFRDLNEYMSNVPLENLFAVYIMSAKICSSTSRVFMIEDGEYIKVFESSPYNKQKEFLKFFENDKDTIIQEGGDTVIALSNAFEARNIMFDWIDDNVGDFEEDNDEDEEETEEDYEEESPQLEGEALMQNAVTHDDYVETDEKSPIEEFFDKNPEKLEELDKISNNNNEEELEMDERYQEANKRYEDLKKNIQNKNESDSSVPDEKKVPEESVEPVPAVKPVKATESESGDIIIDKVYKQH